MQPVEEARFRQLVLGRSEALVRSAYLLVGDRGRAEDLVQTALAKTYVAWPRIRDAAALETYVRRVMVTTAASWWRGLRRLVEHPVAETPTTPVPDTADVLAERDAMWRELAALPVKQRAVLVLRYYEGLSEAEIARVLEVSRGTVKSHTSRAMSTLRRRMTPPLPEAAE